MKVCIVNKKKFIKNISIIIFSILFLATIGINKAYSKESIKYKEEYVYNGDTLWSIAEEESKENKYYKDKDIRNIILDIKKTNNIENSNLEVGQKIIIPTF